MTLQTRRYHRQAPVGNANPLFSASTRKRSLLKSSLKASTEKQCTGSAISIIHIDKYENILTVTTEFLAAMSHLRHRRTLSSPVQALFAGSTVVRTFF